MLRRNTKRGSYLVEATIVVPIFIIAVLMLISIIPVISTIENVNYIAIDEMHLEDTKSAFRSNPVAYPVALKHRLINENNDINSFKTTLYRYKFSRNKINDLISVNYSVSFSEKNPLGLFSKVNFKGSVLSRAFTGTYYNGKASTRAELENDKDSNLVYIFPNWGEKYHNKNCTYVRSNCQMIFLSQIVKQKYSSCHICHSSTASIGSPVFCFTVSGKVYHYGNCKVIDKYYVEIEKDDAIKKGYTPCSKCGGD